MIKMRCNMTFLFDTGTSFFTEHAFDCQRQAFKLYKSTQEWHFWSCDATGINITWYQWHNHRHMTLLHAPLLALVKKSYNTSKQSCQHHKCNGVPWWHHQYHVTRNMLLPYMWQNRSMGPVLVWQHMTIVENIAFKEVFTLRRLRQKNKQ